MSGDKEPVPTAGAVNWEAYSHEELYRMLWQDADVADVSVVATEWAQHRLALDTHAQVLREQRVALLDSWHGPAAEEAADRLAALAARVEKISELAHAGQTAAQEAADALARARAMMPPPPAEPATPSAGDQDTTTRSGFSMAFPSFAPPPPAVTAAPSAMTFPTGPTFTTSSMPSAPSTSFLPPIPPLPAIPSIPAMPSIPSPSSFYTPPTLPNFASMFTPTTTTSGMGTAFGAVGDAGFSFYFGAATADQQKAEAIRAMQAYESSLVGGSKLIDGARGAIPPASQTTRVVGPAAGGVPGGPTTGGHGGVPWPRLLGGGAGLGSGMGVGPVIGGSPPPTGHAVPLAPGQRVGVLPGAAGVLGMPGAPLTGDSSSTRGTAQAAMAAAPIGGRTDSDDERHENRMPVIDHGLFTVEEPATPAVIGQTTGAQS
ncbi:MULTISPECIES: hypothetical protein [Saccharothrix]|uniref:hypothetical protein n=1 Tax=Saccharothrix TaxID=2071 RepID=UPI00095CCCB8|nr:hypothetical protein [Saccharothrix sp. CB00851]OKI36560.1 hypothetical protein A6A25_20995 [Saccharothrix sp. CB00851]